MKYNVFSPDSHNTLQNIVIKDLLTIEIQEALLEARNKGQEQLNLFITERLLPMEERKVKFTDPIRKNKPFTFSSLYQCNTRNKATGSKEKALKADRSVLQRLVMAYDAGRKVDLKAILKHELLPVPLSLTKMNGTLRTGSKSILCDVLLDVVQCPPSLTDNDISQDATLIIDG